MLQAEDSPESRSRIENLRQLLRDAAEFEPPDPNATPDERLSAWLDRISLTGADEDLPEGGVVTMMTVHTSKGLEYPIVFVVHVIEGQFPHSRSAEEPGGVEEERRLAYVAFTRAQQRLIITRCRQEVSFDPETSKPVTSAAAPSRFLFGIPVDACDGDLPTHDEVPDAKPARGRATLPGKEADHTLRAWLSQNKRTTPEAAHRPPRAAPRWSAPASGSDEDEDAPVPDADRSLLPEGDYVTMDVESPAQLVRGTRVIHEVFGAGEIVLRSGATLHVRFPDRIRPVGIADRRLQLLRER
jgi:ATP-dependent exoDNAse (exonuclease V) beta subunit